jgi:hypothetical protein
VNWKVVAKTNGRRAAKKAKQERDSAHARAMAADDARREAEVLAAMTPEQLAVKAREDEQTVAAWRLLGWIE